TTLTFAPSPVGTYNYYVGCKDDVTGCETAGTNRAKVTVVVNPIPTAPIDAKSDKTAICVGETITLSASCGANKTAKWYDASGASLTTLTFAPSPVGTYNYYVGCKDDATGCETAGTDRAKVTVIVNTIPTAPTDAKSDKGAICIGETITLSGTCGTGQTAKWYDESGVALTSLTFAPSPVGTYNYYVGCKSNTTDCETAAGQRKKVTVVVNSIPTAPTDAKSDKSAICVGETITLSASCGANKTAKWYDAAGASLTT
ncbi:hypothetical protein VB796_23740, partial [Arcicella sp. LKC2W]|nr:hypothetical protein [Arcicella sp. LKC2W]